VARERQLWATCRASDVRGNGVIARVSGLAPGTEVDERAGVHTVGRFVLVTTLLLGVVVAFVAGVRHIVATPANPWSRFGVCLVEDTPGATDRFRTFTPVSCDTGVPLGDPMGADYAIVRFDDVDGDGQDDLIVMESEFSCAWAAYCPEVQTLRAFRLIRATPLRVEPLSERSGVRLR
jgi:hypothetical protein